MVDPCATSDSLKGGTASSWRVQEATMEVVLGALIDRLHAAIRKGFVNRVLLVLVFPLGVGLAACASLSLTSTVVSGDGPECQPDSYENVVKQNVGNFAPGTDRDLVVKALSNIAVAIWRSKLLPIKACELKYELVFRQIPPVLDVSFPVEVTIVASEGSVCLNHDDFAIRGSVGSQNSEVYDSHRWDYVENRRVPGIGLGYRKFLPVCFNSAGEVVEWIFVHR